MNTTNRRLLTLSLIFLVGMQPSQPISENTVTLCSIGGGTVVGGLTGWGIKSYAEGEGWSNGVKWGATIGGGALAGVATGALIYKLMSFYTPTGRFNYASGIIGSLSVNPLVNIDVRSFDSTTARITAMYGTSWPLTLAREDLMTQARHLGAALAALNDAHSEASSNPTSYGAIMQQTPALRESAARSYTQIESVLEFITKHPNYDKQVALFEQHEAERRQRDHEAALQRQKLAHKTTEKMLDRDYKRRENERDRQFAATRPNARLNLNIGGR